MARVAFFSSIPLLLALSGCGLITIQHAHRPSIGVVQPVAAVAFFQGGRCVLASTAYDPVLLDAFGRVVMHQEKPVFVDARGAAYTFAGAEREPYEVHINVDVHVSIALHVSGGMRTVDATDGRLLAVDAQGRLLLEGTAPLVVESGTAYVLRDGHRAAATPDLVAEARVQVGVGNDANLTAAAGATATAAFAPSGSHGAAPAATPEAVGGAAPSSAEPSAPDLLAAGAPSGVGDADDAFTAGDVSIGPLVVAPSAFTDGPSEGGGANATVDANANIDVNVDVHVDLNAIAGAPTLDPASPAHDATDASLGMLAGGGVHVDGHAVALSQLVPLSPAFDAAGAFSTNAAVQAHVNLEHLQLAEGEAETTMAVTVVGAESSVPPARQVHLVIDRSSSMHSTWPDVLAAADVLLASLEAHDRVQIVAYGNNAEVAFPLQAVGDGAAARRALARISVGGGTNIEAGLREAYAAAQQSGDGFVILLSDGVPNGGAFTADELAPMARAATQRCTTTTIGLGTRFDANVLRAIAQAGGGSYHVAESGAELEAALRTELQRQSEIAARDLQLRFEPAAGVEVLGGAEAVALPRLHAGEERRIEVRVRVNANVNALGSFHLTHGAGLQAEKHVSITRGRETIRHAQGAHYVSADKDLGRRLDLASAALLGGDHEGAAALLEAHVDEYSAEVGTALYARGRACRRLATALRHLGGDASHGQRRAFAIAAGEVAAQLLR
ncbi:MAG: VWA domain-containing protein [Myxococcota bacterium]